ncbi:MAG: FKBP-type peptidyl-prolyl cis-trans isomerase [Flavobacteriales bacterium]
MKISEGKFVVLNYRLTENNPEGELLEETTDDEPFEFIFKMEPLLEDFENALEGKEAGDSFEVTIPHEKAYGPFNDENVVELPKSTFIVDGEIDDELLEEGEVIPLKDDEGNEIMGVIIEVEKNHVVMDLNHPLAGVDLHFDGKIVLVSNPPHQDLN